MTDLPDGPPAEDWDTPAPAGPPAGDRDAPAPTGVDGGTKPVVAAVSLLSVLLTGFCLVAADRLDRSGPARALAVLAVATALVAVLAAVGGQLTAGLTRPAAKPGRGARAVLAAGLLSIVAVLLAGAAALVAIQPAKPAPTSAASTEPTVVVQRNGPAAGGTVVTAKLSFPGLPPGSVVDATMFAERSDPNPARYLMAHSAARVGAAGPAEVQLTATADPNEEVVIEAKSPGRACSARLPVAAAADASAAQLACTRS